MKFALLFLMAAVLSAALTRILLSSRLENALMDHPNERSLHDIPKPRVGGVGICSAFLTAFVLVPLLGFEPPALFAFLVVGTLVVLVISFIDDVKSLSAFFRIPFHFLAAVLLVSAGISLQSISIGGINFSVPPLVSFVISVLYVVWMINLYNFMDGMDGFAGGMTFIGFGVLGFLSLYSGSTIIAFSCFSISGAALGFLVFNFPPAKVFMGDVGSSTLGCLAAGLSLWADREQAVPLWISVLIFSPFIVDATVTLVRRIFNRKRIWKAHREHYYQKLVCLGWGHRRTVIYEYILMFACAGSAVLAANVRPTGQWIVLAFWLVAYGFIVFWIHRLEVTRGAHGSTEIV